MLSGRASAGPETGVQNWHAILQGPAGSMVTKDGVPLQQLLQGGAKGQPKIRKKSQQPLHQMEVCSWNTGGVPGIYRILELVELGRLSFDVLCIQELKATDEDVRVLENAWNAKGYYVYVLKGSTITTKEGHTRHLGRLMTVVRKTLQQRERHRAALRTAQLLNVEVQG